MSEKLELEAARAAIDELTRRLRRAEGEGAVLRLHLGRVEALLDGWDGLHPNVQRAHHTARAVPREHAAGEAFLAHLARLEARVMGLEGAGIGERYPMAPDQPAQLDCRQERCRFNRLGVCSNASPAITLQADGSAYCWSREEGK